MRQRLLACCLLVAALVGSSGCCGLCCLDQRMRCFYWSHHYDGCSCGKCYWSEWFSDPPACCDPCNQCGHFTGGGCSECDDCHYCGSVRPQFKGHCNRGGMIPAGAEEFVE